MTRYLGSGDAEMVHDFDVILPIILYLSVVFRLVFVSTICRRIVPFNHDIVITLSHTIVNPFVYIYICYVEKYSFNHHCRCISYSSCSIRLYTTESTK